VFTAESNNSDSWKIRALLKIVNNYWNFWSEIAAFWVNNSGKLEPLPTETIISALNLYLNTRWCEHVQKCVSSHGKKNNVSSSNSDALCTYVDTIRFLKLNCIYWKSRRASRSETFPLLQTHSSRVFSLKTFRSPLFSLPFLVFLLTKKSIEERIKRDLSVLYVIFLFTVYLTMQSY